MLFNCLRRKIVLLRGIRFVIILMMIYYAVMSHQFLLLSGKMFPWSVSYIQGFGVVTQLHRDTQQRRFVIDASVVEKKHACLVTKYSAPSCAWSNFTTFQRICKVICFPVTQSDESSSKLF